MKNLITLHVRDLNEKMAFSEGDTERGTLSLNNISPNAAGAIGQSARFFSNWPFSW